MDDVCPEGSRGNGSMWCRTSINSCLDQLELINVYLDHVAITDQQHVGLVFEAKSKISYSKINTPHRVIDMSEHRVLENAFQKVTAS